MKGRLRSTKQREIILETLRGVESHPTADELYQMVRMVRPDISLGTVYRNLEKLAARGIIKKLSLAGSRKRFDGCVDAHYHLRCRDCGRVEDLKMRPIVRLEEKAGRLSDYEITGHSLEFYGLCPACRAARDRNPEGVKCG